MRKHHKEDSSGQEISFRKSSVRGSIPKDSSVRGRNPRWKDTFSIDDKGGEIYQMQSTEAWFQGERWSQGSMSDMTSVLHDMTSVLHQSVSINAKGGYC
jgi:hypothetical protein